ncbi:TonB-dependent receptor [soil metagenome]
MILTSKYAATLALGCSAFAYAVPAMAQQPAESSASASAEMDSAIVVTARRKEERLMDVPAAISVVSAETLMAKGISSPTQLTQAIPSLQQSSSGFGNSTPHFLIRGQRQQLEFMQSDQSVGVYVDEIVVPRQQGLNAGLFDIANVQVLKGPQGTLFGKNQTGGAILFTSQMPKSDFGGYGSVTIGDYNARKFEGAINIPITDSLQVRLAGQVNRRDGYIHNISDNRYYGDNHTDGWRASVHFAPANLPLENWLIVAGSQQNEIGAISKQFSETIGLPGVGTSGLFTLFGSPEGDRLYSAAIRSQAASFGKWESGGVGQYQLANGNNVQIKNFSVTNKTEINLSDTVTLRNIFGYRYLNSYQSANIGGVAGFLFQPGTTATNASAARLVAPVDANGVPQPMGNVVCGPQSGFNCVAVGFHSFNYIEQRQISEEVNLLGSVFDGKIDYILGGYYFREHGTQITSNFVPISHAPRIGIPQNEPVNQSTAVFGQLTWHPVSTVSVTGGLRQTWDKRVTNARTVTSLVSYFPWTGGLIPADGVVATCGLQSSTTTFLPNNTASNPNNCRLSATANFQKLTYTASIDWHVTKDMLLYFVTRKGYRSGGFNQSATLQSAANPTVLTPFNPETVTDYEVGFKGNWRFDNGMRAGLNVAAYTNGYKDIQRALTTLVGSKSVTANAATATIKGIEVEARFEPTPWIEFTGYYSYIQPKFDAFIVPNNGLYRDTGDFTQSKFSGVSSDSGGATIRLHEDVPGDKGTLSASMDYYGQTGTYLQDNNFDARTQSYLVAEYVPGYWVLGANIGWQRVLGKPVDASFNIRNITNKRYITGGVDGSTSGIGTLSYYVGEPRMFTFNLTYRF